MAATITITPWRASSSLTNPMRRILISRSSLLKPRPFERCVRTTSPSSTSTAAPATRKRSSIRLEMVLLPAPESPVNQRTKPLCTRGAQHLLQQHVDGPLRASVGGEMNAALLIGVLLPPPASGALGVAGLDCTSAGIAADTGVAARVQRMTRHLVTANVVFDLISGPVGQRAKLHGSSVEIDLADVSAGFILRAPQSYCPSLQLFELTLERAHFTDIAAEHPLRRVLVEQVGTVQRDHRLHFGCVRTHHFHGK